ncbi:hypothetical protein DBV05_g6724 [Lasiodiplodia theobromae]|uniref:G-protein coupled receptors family 2 profile 2 domain-containing protein n=1 Tax=Lasiodiplodia theobromae TaxID=45133 RepID=A0A5N5DAF7_9PEZI|nr:hypothetical protein DBV05_g6724 [Lasiodiplodia theobromae]
MTSPFNGACPAPFLDEHLFPKSGGFLPGRACALNPLEGDNATTRCCVPCPLFDYVYDDDFKRMTDGAAWVHVVGFILCIFLLISMAILPTNVTRRSFLNIILLVGILLLELGFIIPLARQPEQCYNEITPNDMNTSTTCAFSGAFAAFGGMTLVTWILIRAFFMHLQICWDITPTKYHILFANLSAWTTTIVLTSAVLAHAGVSFRFGGYCHVNHTGSIPTYWAWLLAFGGLAFVLQVATFGYCVKVYLQAALLRSASSMSGARLDSNGSGGAGDLKGRKNSATFSAQSRSRARAAKAAARRVREVLKLQWRSLAIVALAIFTTAFVCVVFIVLDNKQEKLALTDTEASLPWITCMILTRDNEQCLDRTGSVVISQRVVVATLFILAFVGVEAFCLLCRVDMLKAWGDWGKKMWGRRPWRKRDYLMGGPEPEFDLVVARNQRLGSAEGRTASPVPRAVSPVVRGERVEELSADKAERKDSTATVEAPHAL